ncbi:MAG: tetratricopeptide repeat protein [Verrucomicrobia bacterium]|nr:tetratricopeptide repeat protein [Verrucomicrobiota bacterium]
MIVVLAFLAYARSWNAPFVYDDLLAIPENPTIRRLWPLTTVLFPGTEGGVTTSGRPILNLSFALNQAISGNAVWSYHLANTLVHAAAGLLLFGIVRRTLRLGPFCAGNSPRSPDLVALTMAGLWTAHPLHTQAVTYTVQRAESLMGAFYLLTLYAFIRGCTTVDRDGAPRRRTAWLAASVAAAVLGTGTKEVMVTVPVIVLLYDRALVAGSCVDAWRARWRYYLALAATWVLLGALLLSTGGNRGGTVGLGVGVPLWAYPLTQFEAIARYLGLALWPHPLVFEYGTFWVRSGGDLLPFAVLVLPLLATAAWALWRRPVAGFLGAWFFGILAPTSLAPGTIQMIVEHRMYLPLAAVVAGAVWLLARAGGPRLLAAGVATSLAFGLLTHRRNHDYRSALALWSDTVAKRPLNPRAHEGLAEAYTAAGRPEAAVRAHQEAVRLLPDEAHYHYNLGLALAAVGRDQDAERHYRLALRLHPGEARFHNNLAILLVRTQREEAALEHYAAATRLRPEVPLYHYNFAVAQQRLGRYREAEASYRRVLDLQGDHADAQLNLGTTLVRLNRLPEALEHYERARRLHPEDPEYAATHGGALLLAGRSAEALAIFREALQRQPRHLDATFGLANALAALGRREEAIAHYQAVLEQSPTHANAHFKLGNALLDLGQVEAAISHYQAALRLHPGDAEAHHNLGVAFARRERWDDARRAFDEALRLKPDYPDALRHRAQLRAVTGR